MNWWKAALFDTCSLITLDKVLLVRPGLARQFPSSILALAESFSRDQMWQETAERLRDRVTEQRLPPVGDLATLLAARLPRALAEVDKLIYCTAVHTRVAVVTADRRLARVLQREGLTVGNMAVILKELVEAGRLTERGCERVLAGLAAQHDFILGRANPTWDDLKDYVFPP